MRFLVVFLLLLCVALKAQDTVILRDYSKVILNVLHTTNYDVVYTKPNKDRSYFLSFSQVRYIYYRDGSRQNIDSLYELEQKEFVTQTQVIDSPQTNVFGGLERKKDTAIFNKGREDAREYYDYKDHFHAGLFRYAHHDKTQGKRTLNWGFNELTIGVPNREFLQNADYRAGYVLQVRKLKRKYDLITGGFILSFLSTAIILVSLNS